MTKPSLSSQDVRMKIIKLRDSLVMQLEFMQKCIDNDFIFLESYFNRFGDLNYRPVTAYDIDHKPLTYGARTDIMIEPVASKYRATIKSLLDSIRLIESEILPDDDPEGQSSQAAANAEQSGQRRSSLRENFTSDANHSNKAREPDNTPTEADDDEDDQPNEPVKKATKLAENPKPAPRQQEKPAIKSNPPAEPKSNPKPWRTQATFVPANQPESSPNEPNTGNKPQPDKSSVVNTIREELTNPVQQDEHTEELKRTLSNLRGNSNSKMQGLAEKYGKKKG